MSRFDEVKRKVQSLPMALTPSTVSPTERVIGANYGPICSYCIHGYRVWGFEDRAMRDRFVQDFSSRGAERVPS